MTPYKKKIRKQRMLKMLEVFKKMFPNPISELHYTNDFEFLVAVVLSAQCTDKRVNMVTQSLFKKYKNIQDYASADLQEFERDIYSTGFYKNKAKNIIASAILLLEKYNGVLPKKIKELQEFPGVGRKTANVILGNLYHIHEGIAVDTHVIRISKKFDLVDAPFSAHSIEQDLMEIVPKKEWNNINHYMVLYGRYHAPAHAKVVHDNLTRIFPKSSFKLS